MATNVEKLKAAYQAWSNSKGASIPQWLDLVGDDFEMQTVAPTDGLEFADVEKGPAALEMYLTSLVRDWRMDSYIVDAIVGDGDVVAMFGRCTFTFKATGKPVTTPIANLWRFRNGKAHACTEIFDSAKAKNAATPG